MDASEKKFADSVARSWRVSPDPQQWLVLSDLFEQEGDMESAALWRDRAAVFAAVQTRLRILLSECERASRKRRRIGQFQCVTLRQGGPLEGNYHFGFASAGTRSTVSFTISVLRRDLPRIFDTAGFFYKETAAKDKTNEQHLSERLIYVTERIIHTDREILRLYREGAIQ